MNYEDLFRVFAQARQQQSPAPGMEPQQMSGYSAYYMQPQDILRMVKSFEPCAGLPGWLYSRERPAMEAERQWEEYNPPGGVFKKKKKK
jgi:hypothetical protein